MRTHLYAGHAPRPLRRPSIRKLSLAAAACLLSVFSVRTVSAGVGIFETPDGSTMGGQPVDAKVTITTSANQVSVLLQNLQSDPRSVVQCLSGIQFHLNSGQTVGSILSSSGTTRTVAGNGAFSVGGATSMGWGFGTDGGDVKLSLLGQAMAPDHTIIGPPAGSNIYSNANGSIKNGTHSPFIGLSATFTLDMPGVTGASEIDAVKFQFNTGPGFIITGDNTVPEPTAAMAMLTSVGLLALRRRK